jgi:CRP-like cAMP-binding protein
MAGYDEALYRMYLANVPMFARCPIDQLELIATNGEARAFRNGSDIVREGDAGDGFFLVTDGTARVRHHEGDVAELGPGDYFGELSLFDPAPRNATVTAATDVSCVVLAPDAFRRVLDDIPAVRDALLHGMARRLHVLDRQV